MSDFMTSLKRGKNQIRSINNKKINSLKISQPATCFLQVQRSLLIILWCPVYIKFAVEKGCEVWSCWGLEVSLGGENCGTTLLHSHLMYPYVDHCWSYLNFQLPHYCVQRNDLQCKQTLYD